MKNKIKWIESFGGFSQIYSQGLEYAFVTENYEQICKFVFCKDFLQDAIHAKVNGTKASIYGFVYDSKKSLPLCLKKTMILLANSSDGKLRDKIDGCVDFINQIEKILKIRRSTITECNLPPKKYEKGGVWLVKGSSRWIKSPPMISALTLLLRVGLAHKKGNPYHQTIEKIIDGSTKPYVSNDVDYLKTGLPAIKKILTHGDKKLFYQKMENNYPKKTDIGTMHNSMGVVGYARGYTKLHVPYWHRLDEKGKLCLPLVPTQNS